MSQKMIISNAREYNTFLKNRGKFFGLIKKTCATWYAEGKKKRGSNYRYSDTLIITMYTVSYLTSSALRQTVGIFQEYIELCKLDLIVPDFSTMSRRLKTLDVKILDNIFYICNIYTNFFVLLYVFVCVLQRYQSALGHSQLIFYQIKVPAFFVNKGLMASLFQDRPLF